MAYSRNDPSSLSFGARLASVEKAAATNSKNVAELKDTALDRDQKQEANEQRRYRRGERKRASQLLASYETTMEQLQGVDRSALTTAQAFLLDEQIKAKAYAQSPAKIHFDQAALQRLQNWRNLPPIDGAQSFLASNGLPQQTQPATAFERWSTRQHSPEGKQAARERERHAIEVDMNRRRYEASQKVDPKKPSQGFQLGRIRDLNE